MIFKKGLRLLLLTFFILGFAGAAYSAGPAVTEPLGKGIKPYSSVKTGDVGAAQAQSVLIALADSTAEATILQSELIALGIPVVDLMDVSVYTPTLAELMAYDAVITWTNYPYLDKIAMGDVLADYVDSGGGVVLGTFVWSGPTYEISGRIQDIGYSPFEQAGSSLFITACLGTYDTGHPIMAGVTSACDYYRDNVIVESGATLVASWDDGYPFVGVNAAGNVVGITSYPADNRQFTGDVALIYYNAVNSAADPWDNCLMDAAYAAVEYQFNIEAGNVIRGQVLASSPNFPAPLTGYFNPVRNTYSFTIGYLSDNSRHYWVNVSTLAGYTWGILGPDSSFYDGPRAAQLVSCGVSLLQDGEGETGDSE